MAKKLVNVNGVVVPADQAVFSGENRGFRYGDGLFESMRMVRGEVKNLPLHVDRLHKGLKALKMESWAHLDDWFIRQNAEELARRNKLSGDARIRLTVYREGDGLYTPDSNKTGYLMEMSGLNESHYPGSEKGLIVDVYDEVTKSRGQLANLKTCNALVYVLAGVFRKRNQLDEVLILNDAGFLCESMTSNLFVVYQKKLYTPALAEGCIAGVMRQVIIRIAKENGLEPIEAQINPQILNEAEEIFLTNAVQGVQWVMGYNNKRYFNEVSRFLLEKLNAQ